MSVNYDSNIVNALLLTTLAGLSTALGGLVVVMFGHPSNNKLGHMLSFSAGVMLFISFIDLLPEAIGGVGFGLANIAFFVGMFMFAIVLRFVPEPDLTRLTGEKKEKENMMYLGMVAALGISLHNFPEGVAVYLATLEGTNVGIALALAIAAHNIPEGMAVAGPIYRATGSKWEAFKWSFISGVCEPVGAIAFGITMRAYLTPFVVKTVLSGVAGVMTFMCFHELIPSSLKYLNPSEAMYSNVGGMIFISISVWFLQEYMGFKLS